MTTRDLSWTREEFEQHRQHYQRKIAALHAQGFDDDHPLVQRQQVRLGVVDRALTDPRFGLTAVPVPHPTCIDVTATDQTPRSEWVCGPECPKEA
jgi:hypothetical protein